MTTNFWTQDPSVLIDKDQMFEIWPTSFMSYNQKLNALTRIIIILSLLGYFLFGSLKSITTGFVVIFLIVILKAGSMSNMTESFMNGDLFNVEDEIKENEENDAIKKKITEYKKPTTKNPLGNVLLTEINDNPTRKSAPPAFYDSITDEIGLKTKEMIKELNSENIDIEKKLFYDLGNNTEFDYSMRNFYSTANTEIPSDQEAFSNYLYGDMKSTKDGTLLNPK
tara:strand:+ start:2518 stop:3189 length:672 start_codon:yes stop_codon:yes gene_type:complete